MTTTATWTSRSHPDGGTSLYRNDGQGSFVLVTNLAAVYGARGGRTTTMTDISTCCAGVSGRNGVKSHLYHNNGDGTFTSVSDPFPSAAMTGSARPGETMTMTGSWTFC